jgi:hypothetical protein
MVIEFNNDKLEEIVSDALKFMYDPAPPSIRDSSRINAYCSDRVTQGWFAINYARAINDSIKANELMDSALNHILFMNSVVGRISHLEGGIPSQAYTHFKDEAGGNYVDTFLHRVGYTPSPRA